jgi:hypothetical protein
MRIDGAVVEDQLEGRAALRGGIVRPVDERGEMHVLALADAIGHPDGVDGGHGGHHGLGAHQIAHLGLGNAHDAVDGRHHFRPGEGQRGLLHGAAGGVHGRLRIALRGQRVVQLLLADRLLRRQGREALDVLRGLGELRLRPVQRSLGLVEGGAELAGVDLEERIAAPHELPLLVEAPQEVAFDLGPDVRVHGPVEGADPLTDDRHVFLDHGRHFHLGRRWRRRLFACAGDEKDGETSLEDDGTLRQGRLLARTGPPAHYGRSKRVKHLPRA